jgi:UDP-N-acetylmuramate--alanine ligase
MDPDHLDIYGNATVMEDAFVAFTSGIKKGGKLIYKQGLQRGDDLQGDQKFTYCLQQKSADIYATNLRVSEGSYIFDAHLPNLHIENIHLHIGGLHNIENMLAAIAVAAVMGVSTEKIKAAVANYSGVKRRFEFVIRDEVSGRVFIDDYAHHPAELDALISGVRDLYPERHLAIAFQPHLFTRTRDFAEDFAASLDRADEVVLLPIYAARELPIEGVSSELIFNHIKCARKHLLCKEELVNWCKEHKPSLFVTAGAGDIDALRNPIQSNLIG